MKEVPDERPAQIKETPEQKLQRRWAARESSSLLRNHKEWSPISASLEQTLGALAALEKSKDILKRALNTAYIHAEKVNPAPEGKLFMITGYRDVKLGEYNRGWNTSHEDVSIYGDNTAPAGEPFIATRLELVQGYTGLTVYGIGLNGRTARPLDFILDEVELIDSEPIIGFPDEQTIDL